MGNLPLEARIGQEGLLPREDNKGRFHKGGRHFRDPGEGQVSIIKAIIRKPQTLAKALMEALGQAYALEVIIVDTITVISVGVHSIRKGIIVDAYQDI